jgi:hypothetical protein
MSRFILFAMTAVVVALAGLAPCAFAQDVKPINLSLVDPIQIYNRDTAIKGFRFNLIYGNNAGIKGVDIGLANWNTGDLVGLQWGAVNWTEGDFKGWQTGPVNKVGGFMTGLQTSALVSMNESGKGFMGSPANVSQDFIGLQFGIVNYAVELHGIQIGLINVIKNGGMLPFFPIFNYSFD